MTAAEEIFAEAQEIAAWANAQVIRNALIDYPARCGNCEFPEHFDMWTDLLYEYIELRIELHKTKKRIDLQCSWSMFRTDYHLQITKKCEHIRKRMMAYEPCPACCHRYNPTGRSRLPKRNAPTKGKDFFDG